MADEDNVLNEDQKAGKKKPFPQAAAPAVKPPQQRPPEEPGSTDNVAKDWIAFLKWLAEFIKFISNDLGKKLGPIKKDEKKTTADPKGLKTDPVDTEQEKKEDTSFLKKADASIKNALSSDGKPVNAEGKQEVRRAVELNPVRDAVNDTTKVKVPENINLEKQKEANAENKNANPQPDIQNDDTGPRRKNN